LVTFIRPIFFYHKLVNSSPALGFGGVVTPPAVELTQVISDMTLGWDMAVAIAMLKLNIPLIFAVSFERHNQK